MPFIWKKNCDLLRSQNSHELLYTKLLGTGTCKYIRKEEGSQYGTLKPPHKPNVEDLSARVKKIYGCVHSEQRINISFSSHGAYNRDIDPY